MGSTCTQISRYALWYPYALISICIWIYVEIGHSSVKRIVCFWWKQNLCFYKLASEIHCAFVYKYIYIYLYSMKWIVFLWWNLNLRTYFCLYKHAPDFIIWAGHSLVNICCRFFDWHKFSTSPILCLLKFVKYIDLWWNLIFIYVYF